MDASRFRELVTCDPDSARYVGSPEHKDAPSFAGAPSPRADASRCPNHLAAARGRIEAWLRAALRQGHVGEPVEAGWPRYAWHREGGQVYEARLTNRSLGEYKGYPIAAEQIPDGI